jgi:hypothetical protein
MADAPEPSFEPLAYEWLLLRFDADRDSRSPAVEAHVHEDVEGLAELRVLDLGAGAGANMLYLAPRLPVARQHWTLIDRDRALVENVGACVRTFARRVPGLSDHGDELRFGDTRVTWRALDDDFLRPTCPIYDEPVDLVVANAVFDLLSADQLDRFLALAVSRWRDARPGLYFTIHLDHDLTLAPAHPDDDAVRALFHAHMQRVQSFGRALGPDSASVLASSLRAVGFEVVREPSPWRIGARDAAFLQANLDFIEGAVRDMIVAGDPRLGMAELDRWLADRRQAIADGALTMEIAHQDIWAEWPVPGA